MVFMLIFVHLSGQDIQELASRFYQISEQYDAVGASFCLVNNGQVHNFSYGWKDYSRQLIIDNDTKFRIASISKVITAISAMKLVEDGLIDLDSDVYNYLGYNLRNPNFPNNEITLRHLLTHTTGLRDNNAYNNFLVASYSQNPPAISELFNPESSYYDSSIWTSYYAPGLASGWDYSNLSAGLVSTIVETVSQQHFPDFCEDLIFEPLDIEACWNNFSALSDINDLAVLYRYVGGVPTPQADDYQGLYPDEIDLNQIALGWNGLLYAPQGGLRISSADLAKIFIMLQNRGSYEDEVILSEATVNEMEELNWSGSGLGGFFTEMGLQLQRTYDIFSGELFFGHAGEAYGLISDAYYNLERGLAIIFLTNGANFGYGDIFYNYEEAIFNATQEWLDAVPNANDVITLDDTEIYPNVITSLKQKISIKSHSQINKATLYNLKGQVVNKQANIGKEISFSNSALTSGFYLLKLESSQNIVLKKLIIRK